MDLNLRQYFTPDAIVATLGRLPELKTPIMDTFFSDVRTIPRPTIGVRDYGLNPDNLPVVRRGTQSFPMSGESGSIALIEPQPVNPSEFISGADLSNLRMLNGSDLQTEIDNIIDTLRRACRKTAEAMAIQALTGKISYYLREGSGSIGSYVIDYGSIGDASAEISKMFDADGAKISDVVKGVAALLEVLKDKVDGNDVRLLAGYDVFAALCDLAGATSNAAIATATASGISIGGGFTVQLMGATYKNLKTKAVVPVIPAKHIMAVDVQAGHKMLYASLDSMDAGQQALPFFATYEQQKDPSGVKVIGESKPVPVVNVKGIVKAKVLS